jgi:hypothetical protein
LELSITQKDNEI